MANSYVFKGTVDMSEHDAGLRQSAKEVHNYDKAVNDAKNSLDGLNTQSTATTRELLNQLSTLESVGKQSSNFKKQLGQVTKQLADLTVCYRKMTDEEKKSPLGQATAKRIDELKQVAAEYKDAMLDVNAEIKGLASDTGNWDSLAATIDLAKNSIKGFVSITSLGEKETEKLVQVIATLEQVESIANTAIAIGNALQKESAVLLGVKKIKVAAAAAAEAMATKGTKAATVAQAAFNLVAKANPYVLLATALLGLGTALYMFTSKTKEATEAEKEQQKQTEKLKDIQANYTKNLARESSNLVSKYQKLRSEWKNLKTEAEKTKWIKDNANEFDNLGIQVDSVKKAEDIFVNNTQNVIRALELRAKATALEAKMTEAYAASYEKRYQAEQNFDSTRDKLKQVNSKITDEDAKYLESKGYKKGVDYTDPMFGDGSVKSERAARELNARIWSEAHKQRKQALDQAEKDEQNLISKVENDYKELVEEQKKLGVISDKKNPNSNSSSSKSSTSTKTQEILNQGSLKEAQKKVSELEEKVNNISANDPELPKLTAALEKAKKNVKEIQAYINLFNDAEIEANTVLIDEDDVKRTEEYAKQAGTKAKEAFQREIEDLTASLEAPMIGSFRYIENQISNLEAKIEIEADPTKIAAMREEIRILEKQLDNLDKAGTKLHFDDYFEGAKDIISDIGSIEGAWNSLSSSLDNGNPFEIFLSLSNAIFTTVDAFKNITEVIGLFSSATKTMAATQAAASQVVVASQQAETAASISNTTAKSGEAIAEATESGAKLPFPANLAAIAAAVAAVVAALAMIGSYANGGIVHGKTSVGDLNLAKVNNNEMIINTRQQQRLWNMLNGQNPIAQGGVAGGQVEFKIKGDTLYGALKNYSKTASKSGKFTGIQ